MGVLRAPGTGLVCFVDPDSLVGRSDRCVLRLDAGYVSSQHASIRWTGTRWELRDLGSRNGTFLNGARLVPGEARLIGKGAVLAFGHLDQQWVLDDDRAPCAKAVPVGGGVGIPMEGEIVGIPSMTDPRATVYRDADGHWTIERSGEPLTSLSHGSTFDVEGQRWIFCCPDVVPRTSVADECARVTEIHLQFTVSRDEEHVTLRSTVAGQSFQLGSHAYNYLLLTLARQRLVDGQEGLPESSCGWVHQDDLARQIGSTESQVNVDVFRLRKQMATVSVVDPANIIERRPRTKQLRIGLGQITIVMS